MEIASPSRKPGGLYVRMTRCAPPLRGSPLTRCGSVSLQDRSGLAIECGGPTGHPGIGDHEETRGLGVDGDDHPIRVACVVVGWV